MASSTVDFNGQLSVIVPTDDLYDIPLDALNWDSRTVLSNGFAVFICKVIENQYYANLPDILKYMNFPTEVCEKITSDQSPTLSFLRLWSENYRHRPSPNVGNLINILTVFERYDILYDITELVYKDIQDWKDRNSEQEKRKMGETLENIKDKELTAARDDSSTEATDDTANPIDVYDAIFSYCDTDDYAQHIMQKIYTDLSRHYGLKLCKGFPIAVGKMALAQKMEHIKSHCKRVIVLLSESYVKKDSKCYEELYYMKVEDTMAVGRKIIPVLIENIATPEILSDMVCVPYYDRRRLRECYESLYDALK